MRAYSYNNGPPTFRAFCQECSPCGCCCGHNVASHATWLEMWQEYKGRALSWLQVRHSSRVRLVQALGLLQGEAQSPDCPKAEPHSSGSVFCFLASGSSAQLGTLTAAQMSWPGAATLLPARFTCMTSSKVHLQP